MREFGRPIAVVAIEEHDDVRARDMGEPGETGPPVAAPRLPDHTAPYRAAISRVPSIESQSTTMTLGHRSRRKSARTG